MGDKSRTLEDYLESLPLDRVAAMKKLRTAIIENLPKGFVERIGYGMPSYVVPHDIYPDGYHCDPKLPLPFISFASQKNCISFYHMGIYASPELLEWFVGEYPKHNKRKLDMGKSCIRFKKIEEIPYDLVGELVGKMSVNEWVSIYESNIKS